VFLTLRDEAADEARRHLKPHLAKRLDKALARLAQAPHLIESLRAASPKRD
jgi:hypothetical protein